MADKAIGELPVAQSVLDGTLFPVEQQGQAHRLTARQIKEYVGGSISGGTGSGSGNGGSYNDPDMVRTEGGGRLILPLSYFTGSTGPWVIEFTPEDDNSSGNGGSDTPSTPPNYEAGVDWFHTTIPGLNGHLNGIAYGAGKFVTLASNGNQAFYSDDGITWDSAQLPTTNGTWKNVAYGGNKFVAISASGNVTAYSTNGIQWTQGGNLPESNSWQDISYGAGKFVVTCGGGARTSIAAYSSDGGITWNKVDLSVNGAWMPIAYGNNRFVMATYLTNPTAILYSNDGIQWESGSTPASILYRDMAYGEDRFIAVSEYSKNILYSIDGKTWENGASLDVAGDGVDSVYGIAYGGGKFVIVGASGKAFYSDYGVKWESSSLPDNRSAFEVCYGDGRFVAIGGGTSGNIFYSYTGD